MNGQFQEIPATRISIPEEHKQQIIVVLGRMIDHRLTEADHTEGSPTRKVLENPVMKHGAFHVQRASRVDTHE